jgi:hypothetical protein
MVVRRGLWDECVAAITTEDVREEKWMTVEWSASRKVDMIDSGSGSNAGIDGRTHRRGFSTTEQCTRLYPI